MAERALISIVQMDAIPLEGRGSPAPPRRRSSKIMPIKISSLAPPSPVGGKPSQAELAYLNLRRAIVLWHVEPGTWLNESQLQQLSGFGRTPTREAANRLVVDDLLSAVPRNGYQVTDVSLADAVDLYELWATLAPITGRLAVGRLDDRVLSSLRAAVETSTALDEVENLVALSEVLFDAILRATENRWLRTAGLTVFHHLLRLWVLVFQNRAEHPEREGLSRMLTALTTEDPSAGEKAFVDSIEYTRAVTLAAVEKFERERGLGTT